MSPDSELMRTLNSLMARLSAAETDIRNLRTTLGVYERNGLEKTRAQNASQLYAPPMDITTTTGHTHT